MKLNRSKITGRFISNAHAKRIRTLRNKKVVNGRLYDFSGITVRAGRKINQMRMVSAHKRLFGYVRDNELAVITPKTVKSYLENSK
jgi:hypothetical protein